MNPEVASATSCERENKIREDDEIKDLGKNNVILKRITRFEIESRDLW